MNISKQLSRMIQKPIPFALWTMAKKGDLNVPRRRSLCPDGAVLWDIGREPRACADHLELSGFHASAILSYGKTAGGTLRLMKHLVVPALRTLPDVTQSSFSFNFYESALLLQMDGKPLKEQLQTVKIRGMLELQSQAGEGLRVIRSFYPSAKYPALLEEVTLKNTGSKTLSLQMKPSDEQGVHPEKRCKNGPFYARTGCADETGSFASDPLCASRFHKLAPGGTLTFYGVYFALRRGERLSFNVKEEISRRKSFTEEMFHSLSLETPLPLLNAQFSHCLLRGSESIFATPHGLMHGPGGGNYYAALWTNDQCEYANPFFPFSGYGPGLEQAINCYRLYGAYMDRSDTPMAEKKPLVTSITCGGEDYWNGAGDRGDASMYAYGLGRFLLETSDKALTAELYPNLVWCLDFALSRKNAHGVIQSDSDELENRFPSGNCNLFTSCTTYDALKSGQLLAEHLGDTEHASLWGAQRGALKQAIESYFGDRVEGYETYRYYDGNTELRAWICMPLTVGIYDRAEETVRALFSDRLYRHGMLKTASHHKTTWDRSLLFSLRGVFLSGHSEKGMRALKDYCHNRLLGSHAPYPFEAWPEGNRAQLAAESLLFARIITEGLCGLRASGWKKLSIRPRLTKDCPWLNLSSLRLFGECFDLHLKENSISIDWNGQRYVTSEEQAAFDFETRTFYTEQEN